MFTLMTCCVFCNRRLVDSWTGCRCCRALCRCCHHGRRCCRRIKTSSFKFIQVLYSCCLIKFRQTDLCHYDLNSFPTFRRVDWKCRVGPKMMAGRDHSVFSKQCQTN